MPLAKKPIDFHIDTRSNDITGASAALAASRCTAEIIESGIWNFSLVQTKEGSAGEVLYRLAKNRSNPSGSVRSGAGERSFALARPGLLRPSRPARVKKGAGIQTLPACTLSSHQEAGRDLIRVRRSHEERGR